MWWCRRQLLRHITVVSALHPPSLCIPWGTSTLTATRRILPKNHPPKCFFAMKAPERPEMRPIPPQWPQISIGVSIGRAGGSVALCWGHATAAAVANRACAGEEGRCVLTATTHTDHPGVRMRRCGGGAVWRCRAGMGAGEVRVCGATEDAGSHVWHRRWHVAHRQRAGRQAGGRASRRAAGKRAGGRASGRQAGGRAGGDGRSGGPRGGRRH